LPSTAARVIARDQRSRRSRRQTPA
jgi:hypothetical protein